MTLMTNELIVFLFLEGVIWVMQAIAMVSAVQILAKWDFSSVTPLQYRLEKRAYLVVAIIFFSLLFKIILLPFFSYMIDRLALIVPGAMCGAGVISANDYGFPLLVLKFVIVLLMGLWIVVNRADMKARDYPYFRLKFWLFLVIFLLVSLESVMDLLYITNISLAAPVACCSTIYGVAQTDQPLPFGLDIGRLLILFYLLYLLSVVALFYRYALVNLLASFFFVYIAYFAVVHFFGTYVYELPTHKCPFCMLQQHYFYVGYVIWGTLLLGLFFSLSSYVMEWLTGQESIKMQRLNAFFTTLFVLLCSLYVIVYYLKTGVLLS